MSRDAAISATSGRKMAADDHLRGKADYSDDLAEPGLVMVLWWKAARNAEVQVRRIEKFGIQPKKTGIGNDRSECRLFF